MTLLRAGGVIAALLLAAPTTAFANDYISTSDTDWFRFRQQGSSQEIQTQITQTYGNWRQWSNFGGLGATWVYTSPDHDWFWIFNGTGYSLVANLSGSVGSSRNVDLPPCNTGTATIAARGPLTTPAGTFSDVTELRFRGNCADAGTTRMWFAKGIGIVKWEESSFAGARTYELRAARVGNQTLPTAPANPSTTSGGVNFTVSPSEHARMETILWGANDTYLVRPTYRDAFRGLDGSGVTSTVIVASQGVASQLRYEMAQDNVPLGDVEILVASLDSVWMRDYGPIILKAADGSRVVANPEYYPGRPNDDRFPRAYANYRGWPVVDVRVGFEGGNYATDGRGMQVSSNGVKWFNRDMSTSAIEREFAKFGTRDMVWVDPLIDEGTTHIDMFMRIMSDTEALVSRYPSGHRQNRIVDAAARTLQAKGYTVTRVLADSSYDEYATYSNSVLANGIALVPQYRSSTRNRDALAAYRGLGFRAVGIDSQLIIRYSGATHCISMQVPAGN